MTNIAGDVPSISSYCSNEKALSCLAYTYMDSIDR